MPPDSVEIIAEELFSYLADRFPVCCSSDEFIYFPQALSENGNWSRWDDLSLESVQDAVLNLRTYRERLGRIGTGDEEPGSTGYVNNSVLSRVTQVLEEQLEYVRHHEVQPTFVLMVATVGLVQAIENGGDDALRARLETLPEFLKRFRTGRKPIPDLYREAGIRMAGGFSRWLLSLPAVCDPGAALDSVEDLVRDLSSSPATPEFRLERDILERIVHYHTGSGMETRDCLLEIEDELGKMRRILESEAALMGYGRNWERAYDDIGRESFSEGGKTPLLMKEIHRLREHCLVEGFPGIEDPDIQSLVIEPLPESLTPVRSADSYSARPGNPYRGGVFYIFGDGVLGSASGSIHPAYRMTAAHETYPGHHLQDMCRWNHPDPLRRPIEYPLFYEGWACFGEELMLSSGAFERGYDRLILARRRHRHAVRGKVDLLLHRGDLDLEGAALQLVEAGFSRERAGETVNKYALRPAYQLCYTVGHRRFKALFASYGKRGVGAFAETVLAQGEIPFEDLERVFQRVRQEGKR